MNLKKERNEIEKSKKDTNYQYPIPLVSDQARKPKKKKEEEINKRKNQNEIERRKQPTNTAGTKEP